MCCTDGVWRKVNFSKSMRARPTVPMQESRENIPPHGPLLEKTLQVASPIASGPTEALLHILWVVLKRCQDFAFRMVLDPGLVAVVHHPSGQEVVVVSVELKRSPSFMFELMLEFFAADNLSAICNGPSRKTWQTTVPPRAGGTIPVSPDEISSA